MLRDLNIENVYDSADGRIVDRLIRPLLENSIQYMRGVGFFSSGWLRVAAQGLVRFVENNGKAKFIVSPHLSEEDWEAIKLGEEAKRHIDIAEKLRKSVIELENSLERDTLNALSWMIFDGVLEIRIAVPRIGCDGGMYHDKVGVVTDSDGYSVAFHGSLNDSFQGTRNGEAFSVFKSWIDGQRPYWQDHQKRLETLWNDQNPQFSAFDLPEAIHKQITNLRISNSAPYSKLHNYMLASEKKKEITLWDYQKLAVDSWFQNGMRGLFEMATGTGKTLTAISCALRQLDCKGELFLVVLVPYQHLLVQWAKDIDRYFSKPILCGSNMPNWKNELRDCIQDFNLGIRKAVCVIAVNQTGASTEFRQKIARVRAGNTMLIGDEVHSLGARRLREGLMDVYTYRLGLSATPRRWYDDEGTDFIVNYFGNICFEYPLEKAIEKGNLTQYEYFPSLIALNESEYENYKELTARISKLFASKEMKVDDRKKLEHLLIERARIFGSAEGKLSRCIELLKQEIEECRLSETEPFGIIVYCAPGHHAEALSAIAKLGLRCHEFVADVDSNERRQVLEQFENKFYQVLIAIKCLDEGVDVPSTRIAYIMASSTNPKEFIQRRGRILRKAPGKTKARVYDFIVVAPEKINEKDRESAKTIIRRELPRFAEFSAAALNKYSARKVLMPIAQKLGIIHLLDKKPWEIYAERNRDEEAEDGEYSI